MSAAAEEPTDEDARYADRFRASQRAMEPGMRIAIMTDEGYRRHVIGRTGGRPDTFWNAPEFTNKP